MKNNISVMRICVCAALAAMGASAIDMNGTSLEVDDATFALDGEYTNSSDTTASLVVTLAEAATYVEDDEIPLGKIQSVLDSTVDESQLTPQMRRMMQRQKENSKRVEESIKGTKANPSWYVPLFCTLMVIGLVWAVVFYLTNNTYPIPGIGFWNLAIAFGFILVGFLMTVGWR